MRHARPRPPPADDDAANSAQVVMGMPPVQKAALAMLPRLAPTHVPQLYPEYIFTIVRLVRPEHVIELWEEQAAAAAVADAAAGAPAAGGVPPPAAGPPAAGQANGAARAAAAGTVKQPPGQVAQAKFALTSAFLEKVGGWVGVMGGWRACVEGGRGKGGLVLVKPHAASCRRWV
jgi:hypothetical protein